MEDESARGVRMEMETRKDKKEGKHGGKDEEGAKEGCNEAAKRRALGYKKMLQLEVEGKKLKVKETSYKMENEKFCRLMRRTRLQAIEMTKQTMSSVSLNLTSLI